MGGLSLLRRARLAGLDVWTRNGRRCIEGPEEQQALAHELLEHKDEVLVALREEQEGPWPIETWGPLLPVHWQVRTLVDLFDLLKVGRDTEVNP